MLRFFAMSPVPESNILKASTTCSTTISIIPIGPMDAIRFFPNNLAAVPAMFIAPDIPWAPLAAAEAAFFCPKRFFKFSPPTPASICLSESPLLLAELSCSVRDFSFSTASACSLAKSFNSSLIPPKSILSARLPNPSLPKVPCIPFKMVSETPILVSISPASFEALPNSLVNSERTVF